MHMTINHCLLLFILGTFSVHCIPLCVIMYHSLYNTALSQDSTLSNHRFYINRLAQRIDISQYVRDNGRHGVHMLVNIAPLRWPLHINKCILTALHVHYPAYTTVATSALCSFANNLNNC